MILNQELIFIMLENVKLIHTITIPNIVGYVINLFKYK
jgi:hypothetical protein